MPEQKPGSPEPDNSLPIRLNVNINPECKQSLEDWSAVDGVTVTETVYRAISTYDMVRKMTIGGRPLQVIDPETDTVIEIRLFD